MNIINIYSRNSSNNIYIYIVLLLDNPNKKSYFFFLK